MKIEHMVPIDEDLGEMLNWAVRYSLGRQTYAVSDTCSYVSKLIPHLDERTICCMQRDIRNQRSLGYGMDCDEQQWMCLLSLLTEEIQRRNLTEWK